MNVVVKLQRGADVDEHVNDQTLWVNVFLILLARVLKGIWTGTSVCKCGGMR